ncbi:MAG: hypothetical protein ACR2QE_19625 [Acidimicrobiales bacterium]
MFGRRPKRRHMVQMATVLTVLALVAASCTSDSDETGATDDSATTSSQAAETTTPVVEGEPDTDTGDDAGSQDAEPTESDEPVELTATDTGVTESVIRVGAVMPDIEVIGRDPGDVEAKFQTIADAINAEGGINGRTIELTFRAPNPLEDAGFDATCIELTEDLEVFAAIGLFPRTNADCYAARNDTIVVSTFEISADQMATYTAPGITITAHGSRLVDARIAALIDGGVLAEGSKVALHGTDQARDAHEQYIAALEAAGIEVVADTVGLETGQDLLALEAEMQIFTEVWQSSGAEAVMASTALGSQAILIGYNNSGIDLPILLPEDTGVNPSLMQTELGLDLTPFELATALVGGADQATKYETGQDGVRECVDAFETASGEEVALDESRNNLGPTVIACQAFDIFTQIAEAAGPELTTESYAAAAEAFGPIEVTDLAEASLAPGKFDLDDSVGVIAEFNPETVQFEPVG